MIATLAILCLVAAAGFAGLLLVLSKRNAVVWQVGYLRHLLANRGRRRRITPPVHVLFCFVDHFEPKWGGADERVQQRRVERWCREYRLLAGRHRDADGHFPRHSFFYPAEEYEPEYLADIADLCRDGFGEIEVHLHHDRDTEQNFRRCVEEFVRTLHDEHGALGLDNRSGAVTWAFIHGNWALDNSEPSGRWCGLNNEIRLLAELGCYADFTLPSAPSGTQTRRINSIYYARDDPDKPKSHDTGTDVSVGVPPSGDLMIIQGVLGWNWSSRILGVIPRIENSDVRANQRPTRQRVDSWIKTGVSVVGRPEWVVVKVHTHGAQDEDMDVLLGQPMDDMFTYLESTYNDGKDYVLHYVSARELYNIVKAAEAGESGDPSRYRNYLVQSPSFSQRLAAAERK